MKANDLRDLRIGDGLTYLSECGEHVDAEVAGIPMREYDGGAVRIDVTRLEGNQTAFTRIHAESVITWWQR